MTYSARLYRPFVGVLVAALALGIAISCSDSSSRPTSPRALPSRTSQTKIPVLAPITPEAKARAAAARQKGLWAANLHTKAMNEIRQSLKAWRASGPHSRQAACDAAWGIVRKYLLEAAESAGVAPAALNKSIAAAAPPVGCTSIPPLALSEPRMFQGRALLSIFAARTLDDSVTGAWGDYAGGFNDAFNNSTPAAVASAAYAVVDQAAANGIDQADLEVLGGMADATASSAYDWYSEQQSGTFDDGCCGGDPMSIFLQRGSAWRIIGWSDVGGLISGAYSTWEFGPQAVLGGATAGMIIASGSAALAMM